MGVKHTKADNLPGGILAVNKESGMTSHDVVNRVRRLYGTNRVGHAGTLDPLAEGVLVVLVGRAAKACEYISSERKVYTATLKIGLVTDTEDITGEVLEKYSGELPSYEAVADAASRFTGKILQTPPMYSALKVNGQKLYELARKGIEVERQAREIEVFGITVKKTQFPDEFTLTVDCSGGTYIRTLCADIGKYLGCGGVMASLRRDMACGIALSECHTLNEISEFDEVQKQGILIDVDKLFEDTPKVSISGFFEKLFRDGCPVYQHKINTNLGLGIRVRVCDSKGEFFALGEVIQAPEGTAIKSIKIFKL